MPRKLFKLKFAKSKGKKLTPISEESHTVSVTGGEAEEKVEQLPPELPPPRLPPPRIPPRGTTTRVAEERVRRLPFLDKNSVYENLPANRETYVNVCPLHRQQLNRPFCDTCNA